MSTGLAPHTAGIIGFHGKGEFQQVYFQKIVTGTPDFEFCQSHKKISFLRVFAFTKFFFCSIITSEHQKSKGVADL